MSTSEFLIYLVIILIVVTLIITIIIAFALNRTTPPPSTFVPVTGEFLAQCATAPTSCQSNLGLTCDGLTYLCKKVEGQVCESASDCATGLYCSGLCTSSPNGGLDQPCPCNTGYSCDTTQALHVCKADGGTTCTHNADCISQDCLNGVCTSGFANALPCSTNSQCSSEHCSNGFCQPPGVTTGMVGAACTGLCTGQVGALCSAELACQCNNGEQQPGTCSTTTAGILSICSEVTTCSSELICYQPVTGGGAQLCTGAGCACRFPYTDPNHPPTGIECIAGMSLENGICQNDRGLGCQNSFHCASELCSGGAVVTRYTFDAAITPTAFLGTVATSARPVSGSFPFPNLRPRRFLVVPQPGGTAEALVLIDPVVGIVQVLVNLQGTIINSWSVVLASTPTRQVMDAAWNGTAWLFLYKDTTTPNSYTTVYTSTDFTNLVPFNVQVGIGLPGTQYTTGNAVITIDYLDYSRANDSSPGGDVLLTSGTTVYRKLSSQTHYSIPNIVGGEKNGQPITAITGPAMFYYDNGENLSAPGPPLCPSNDPNNPVKCSSADNIGSISSYTDFPQILNFSGDIAGWATPVDIFNTVNYRTYQYSIYSNGSMSNGGAVMTLNNTASGDGVIAITTHSQTAVIPGWIGSESLVGVGESGFYLFSAASCA